MTLLKLAAVVLLSSVACVAESAAAGKWTCTNVSSTGMESSWTLVVKAEAAKLSGYLTDGSAEIPLSDLQSAKDKFDFRFFLNDKPYAFDGKIDGKNLEGAYSGEEAKGKLRCTKQ